MRSSGDLGMSFEYRAPVADIIWNRLGMTALVAFCTLAFVWVDRISDRRLLGVAPVQRRRL